MLPVTRRCRHEIIINILIIEHFEHNPQKRHWNHQQYYVYKHPAMRVRGVGNIGIPYENLCSQKHKTVVTEPL